MNEPVRDAVEDLVEELQRAEVGTVREITIQVQDSGELPFRVAVLEEQFPLVDLASIPPLSDTDA